MSKDKADLLSKIVDALYKKLVVLIPIAGGFGAYSISFFKQNSSVGYMFAIVFMLTSIAIFVSYTKLNATIKELESLKNG